MKDSKTSRALRSRAAVWVMAALLTTSCAAVQGATEADSPPSVTAPTTAGQSPSAAPSPDKANTPSSATPSASSPGPAASSSPSGPAAGPAPASAPVAEPTWLRVETADIDMPILPLAPTAADLANQSLVPPYTEDAYWISSYGRPGQGSQNTTYITGHSWIDRNAPFNRLSTEVEVGDPITLTTGSGSLDYVVDSVTTHDKDTLKNSDIWNIVPNRLVLISCFIEDPWGKNVVVTAAPA